MNPLLPVSHLLGCVDIVFVRGCKAAGLATINMDALQSEAKGLV